LGIALYESKQALGGLAHAMLPRFDKGRCKDKPERYADTSIYLMLDSIIERGGSKRYLTAKLVGGAQMFSFSSNGMLNIGEKNIIAARETLKAEHIRIKSEDVGGIHGRSIFFDLKNGKIRVKTLGQSIACI
jgi:chemotaxis protein CheD